MLIDKDVPAKEVHYLIRSYGAGFVHVNETRHTHNLIISPQTLKTVWPMERIENLSLELLEPALALEPEVLLIGSGTALIFPPARLVADLLSRRIGLEVMNTASACRTYNILATDGRHVVAALVVAETSLPSIEQGRG
jgi:uncharacterized protein